MDGWEWVGGWIEGLGRGVGALSGGGHCSDLILHIQDSSTEKFRDGLTRSRSTHSSLLPICSTIADFIPNLESKKKNAWSKPIIPGSIRLHRLSIVIGVMTINSTLLFLFFRIQKCRLSSTYASLTSGCSAFHPSAVLWA